MNARIVSELSAVSPLDDLERAHLDDAHAWVKSGAPLFRVEKPATPPKHLVSYFAVIDGDRILLVDHRNAQLWLPTGGHVEPDEDPRTTVVRELKEELGLEVPLESIGPPLMVTVTTTVGLAHGHTDVSLWYTVASRADPGVFILDRRVPRGSLVRLRRGAARAIRSPHGALHRKIAGVQARRVRVADPVALGSTVGTKTPVRGIGGFHETSHWHRRHLLQGQRRPCTAGLVQAAPGNRCPGLGRSCLRLDRRRGQADGRHDCLVHRIRKKASSLRRALRPSWSTTAWKTSTPWSRP